MQYPELGKKIKQQIKNSKFVELDGAGHIPHIQEQDLFKKLVFDYL